jgi:hypothetical protein
MKGEKKKIGVKVDSAVYDRFVNFVEEKHGTRRGVLGMELEKAMRNRMDSRNEDDLLREISEDVKRIKDTAVEADGGSPALEARTHTQEHTREDKNNEREKPPSKAPTGKKVEFLFETFVNDEGEFDRRQIEKHITQYYDFGDRTVEKYAEKVVERIADEFEVYQHPKNKSIYAYGKDPWDELR